MIERLSPLSREVMVDFMMSHLDMQQWEFEEWLAATTGLPITIEEALDECRRRTGIYAEPISNT